MNVNQGSLAFHEVLVFVKFVVVVGIYCRKTENQKRVCIVKIFGVHAPQLRHNSTKSFLIFGYILVLKVS